MELILELQSKFEQYGSIIHSSLVVINAFSKYQFISAEYNC